MQTKQHRNHSPEPEDATKHDPDSAEVQPKLMLTYLSQNLGKLTFNLQAKCHDSMTTLTE